MKSASTQTEDTILFVQPDRDGSSKIKASLWYKVLEGSETKWGFRIINDSGLELYCRWEKSLHLDGGNWIKKRVPTMEGLLNPVRLTGPKPAPYPVPVSLPSNVLDKLDAEDEARLEKIREMAVTNPLCVNPCSSCKFERRYGICHNIMSKAGYAEAPWDYRGAENDAKAVSCSNMRKKDGLCGPRGILWQPTLWRRLKFWKDW